MHNSPQVKTTPVITTGTHEIDRSVVVQGYNTQSSGRTSQRREQHFIVLTVTHYDKLILQI